MSGEDSKLASRKPAMLIDTETVPGNGGRELSFSPSWMRSPGRGPAQGFKGGAASPKIGATSAFASTDETPISPLRKPLSGSGPSELVEGLGRSRHGKGYPNDDDDRSLRFPPARDAGAGGRRERRRNNGDHEPRSEWKASNARYPPSNDAGAQQTGGRWSALENLPEGAEKDDSFVHHAEQSEPAAQRDDDGKDGEYGWRKDKFSRTNRDRENRTDANRSGRWTRAGQKGERSFRKSENGFGTRSFRGRDRAERGRHASAQRGSIMPTGLMSFDEMVKLCPQLEAPPCSDVEADRETRVYSRQQLLDIFRMPSLTPPPEMQALNLSCISEQALLPMAFLPAKKASADSDDSPKHAEAGDKESGRKGGADFEAKRREFEQQRLKMRESRDTDTKETSGADDDEGSENASDHGSADLYQGSDAAWYDRMVVGDVTGRVWFYREGGSDPKGPHTIEELREWEAAGFFEEFEVRHRKCANVFIPARDAIARVDALLGTAAPAPAAPVAAAEEPATFDNSWAAPPATVDAAMANRMPHGGFGHFEDRGFHQPPAPAQPHVAPMMHGMQMPSNNMTEHQLKSMLGLPGNVPAPPVPLPPHPSVFDAGLGGPPSVFPYDMGGLHAALPPPYGRPGLPLDDAPPAHGWSVPNDAPAAMDTFESIQREELRKSEEQDRRRPETHDDEGRNRQQPDDGDDRHMHIQQSFSFPAPPVQIRQGPTFADIQREEEERAHARQRAADEQRRKELAEQEAQRRAFSMQAEAVWGSGGENRGPSLAEIQQEQERELRKQRAKEQAAAAAAAAATAAAFPHPQEEGRVWGLENGGASAAPSFESVMAEHASSAADMRTPAKMSAAAAFDSPMPWGSTPPMTSNTIQEVQREQMQEMFPDLKTSDERQTTPASAAQQQRSSGAAASASTGKSGKKQRKKGKKLDLWNNDSSAATTANSWGGPGERSAAGGKSNFADIMAEQAQATVAVDDDTNDVDDGNFPAALDSHPVVGHTPWGGASVAPAGPRESLADIEARELERSKAKAKAEEAGPGAGIWGRSAIDIVRGGQRAPAEERRAAEKPRQRPAAATAASASAAKDTKPSRAAANAAAEKPPQQPKHTANDDDEDDDDEDEDFFWGPAQTDGGAKGAAGKSADKASGRQQQGGAQRSTPAKDAGASRELLNWCRDSFRAINANTDTALVQYLLTLDDEQEIKDYVFACLGESGAAARFVDEFCIRKEFAEGHASQARGSAVAASTKPQSATATAAAPAEATGSKKTRRRKRKGARALDASVLGFTSAPYHGDLE